jgi:hypothetical protein
MTSQRYTFNPQRGLPGHCFVAQVWDSVGKSVATFDATVDPATASNYAATLTSALNSAAPVAPAQAPRNSDAIEHLRALTTALDGAFISSWQSTHAWKEQLDAAKEFLKGQP